MDDKKALLEAIEMTTSLARAIVLEVLDDIETELKTRAAEFTKDDCTKFLQIL